LILVALEDMSYEEAAHVTGVPVGTIRSRLSRARHSLMSKVAGLEIGDVSPEVGITRRKKAGSSTVVGRPSEPPRGNYQRAS
jgi:hypothetical protein